MTAPFPHPPRKRGWFKPALVLVVVCGCVLLGVVFAGRFLPAPRSRPAPPPVTDNLALPRQLSVSPHLTLWWDNVPSSLEHGALHSRGESNIHPRDYAGPQACRECHPGNYELWSRHPHRWMNVLADDTTIKGDFSGAAISYRGGRATFYHQAGQYFMKVERDAVRRIYAVNQTIGSRFYQYYVGKQLEGPEPKDHPFYHKDHVLQFGYWLSRQEWVPVVHIGPELPDVERADPVAPPDRGRHYAEYAVGCNYCHSTFPMADLIDRIPNQIGEYAPAPLHWSMRRYLQEARPEVVKPAEEQLDRHLVESPFRAWEAGKYAVTFGVSCEACHLGAKAHVESRGKIPPKFFPTSPHLYVEATEAQVEFGRSHDNVNWACGRCHVGNRPQFAAGMSTWNSVEYSDAMRGSCYSKLRCVDCHNPHRATGPKWSQPADKDDAVCLKCHEQFVAAGPRAKHTHHTAGSEGARCLSCHMPRINEGLEDVVRTHMIYSPTRADMIEANHPNACNLCHTDRPIDWTLGRLREWYGKTYDDKKIAAHYPQRAGPVGQGWLKSDNMSVRLVAAEAMTRARDLKALPQLLDALDDPYLLNRQFASKGLEEMLNLRLSDSGYRFYMTSAERRQPLADLRARLVRPAGAQR